MDRIKGAELLCKRAEDEFKKAEAINDGVGLRDACDKAWLAVIEATNALFIKKGMKEEELPKGYRGRKYFLRKYADRNLRNLFDVARSRLHIGGFHEGVVEFDEFPEYIEDVKEYIDLIKRA